MRDTESVPLRKQIFGSVAIPEQYEESYTDGFGVQFSPDGKRLLKAPRGLSHYIPTSVQVVCDNAFSECKSLESVTFPAGLTSIGEEAFSGCESLKAVTLPNGLREISGDSFAGLQLDLRNESPHFYVEDNVLFSADKKQLITYCSNKVQYTIPHTVTNIEDGAFYGCSRLESVTFPEGLTSIGYWTFMGCESLEKDTADELLRRFGLEVI